MRYLLAILLAGAALFGCSAQHGTSYLGEPLAVLHGTVQTTSNAAPPPLEVGLVWVSPGYPLPDGGQRRPELVISPIPVSGQFPSAFTLDVTTPPLDDVLNDCVQGASLDGGPQPGRYAFGEIDAVIQGADASDYFQSVYGSAYEFRVVYLDRDVTDCDLLFARVRGVTTRGYHLVRRIPGPCAVPETSPLSCAYFEEVPLATSIDLPVASDVLRFGPRTSGPPGIVSNPTLTAGPNCVSPVPADPSSGSPCLFFILQGSTAASQPLDCIGAGLSAASDADVAQLLGDMPQLGGVCEVAQIRPSDWGGDTCAQSAQAGWCYVSGAAAASCPEGAVFFSPSAAPPPQGAPGQFPLLFGQFICP